ncbi:TonB family protein [Pseudomonas sp. RC10]|uniref:TonB family protein n=1 Tax=Pseudomonas TaxID=286 RepID=UPI00313A3A3D
MKSQWKVSAILSGCALMLSMSVGAREMHPLFERYVSPTYPSALRGGKLFSSVRVHYDIHHDGTVTDVRVVEQTDQKAANSALSAVKRWQFEPWDVTEEMPARIGESVHFVFDQERLEKRLRIVISWARRDVS